jgi:FMN phosphatase YigB (HAD superfamily)
VGEQPRDSRRGDFADCGYSAFGRCCEVNHKRGNFGPALFDCNHELAAAIRQFDKTEIAGLHRRARARGYKPDGTLFHYLIEQAGVARTDILHSAESQFTDLVGGKPLGLTIPSAVNSTRVALPRPVWNAPPCEAEPP